MKQPLFEEIPVLLEREENFAYFCKFYDIEREHGTEYFFETDQPPLLEYNDPENILNNVIPQKLKEMSGEEPLVPLFLSYEIIETIYNMRLANRSKWPLVGAIIPSSIKKADFTRSAPGFSRLNNEVSRIAEDHRIELEHSIEEIVERVRNGEMLQTVMSNRFNIKNFDAFEVMKYMILQDRSRYVYYYKFNDLEIIGSSPESVFVRQGNQLTIHPIAGTRRRADGPDSVLIDDLLNDNKELCEHRMLVDLARNDLSRVCEPGTVKVLTDMIAEKFYSVIHLTSIVNGTLSENILPFDIVSAVFPAGTVSGAPKRRAMEIIDHYETTGRGVYGGGVGIFGKDMIDIALPIRTAYRSREEAYVQAAAGIVKDSVATNEVKEIMAKANTIMAGGLSCV